MNGTFPCVLSLQVENLHSALEQERSKTKSLKTEVTKLQVHHARLWVHYARLWVHNTILWVSRLWYIMPNCEKFTMGVLHI